MTVLLAVWSCTTSSNRQQSVSVASPAQPQSFQPYAIDSSRIETLPSGLKMYVHRRGSGNLPQVGQQVVVHYRGQLLNGEVFDDSYERGDPFTFTLGQGQVIKGWDEGIARLPVGSQAVLIVPPHLGYGERDLGVIPPNSTLIFYVEVLAAQ